MTTNEQITIGSNLLRNFYQKVNTFKYLGSLLRSVNSIYEEIKYRIKAGNPGYYSVQILLSSQLLSKNMKIKIHESTPLPAV